MGQPQSGTDHSTPVTRTISGATQALGSATAILTATGLMLLWLVGGLFVQRHFENQLYQLLVNTVTSIVTFVMVFVIQSSQNRDSRAIQAKLEAQNEALLAIARRLHIEEDLSRLARLGGLEDAPESNIRDEQQRIRRSTHTRPRR
jgi:low affinity Fe/Cu permease